jgi:hypothetical protein
LGIFGLVVATFDTALLDYQVANGDGRGLGETDERLMKGILDSIIINGLMIILFVLNSDHFI